MHQNKAPNFQMVKFCIKIKFQIFKRSNSEFKSFARELYKLFVLEIRDFPVRLRRAIISNCALAYAHYAAARS